MTSYQAECFLAVAGTLSFAKAAEKMCITQPAISYQIKSLESELEVSLFERTTRSVRLTPAGQAFYQDMGQIQVYLSQAVKRARDISSVQKVKLSVGIRKLFDYDSMSKMILSFKERFPGTSADVIPQEDNDPFGELRAGKIDIAFCYSCEHTQVSDVALKRLYSMNYYALMNPSNPLAGKKTLTFADLKGQKVVTGGSSGSFISACAGPTSLLLEKAEADLSISVPSYESALIAIQANEAMAVLPMLDKAVIPGMVKIPIRDCPPVDMEIAWMKSDSRVSVSAFTDIATRLYERQEK